MEILHLRPSDYRTAAWSGGTTTELFLYPQSGSYAARDFQVRISSATVETPESDFTPLPGVERFITPLRGGFTLTHPGRPPVVLAPLDAPYRFSGDIATHCIGTATDFNLMLNGCDGELSLCRDIASLSPGLNAFYPVTNAQIFLAAQGYALQAGELLVVFSETEAQVTFAGATVLACHAKISR